MNNLLTEWSRLLLGSLHAEGIRHAVISPGSRSTPLTAAALALSSKKPDFVCHSVIDERAAAFFALGQAKITGRPVLLLCTSGSAAAHYLPALVEATHSRVPLVVLSANRPFEQLDCEAPQTIDQTGLFGRHVRWFADLGMPDAHHDALFALRRRAVDAVRRATLPVPGPVHLDFHARKPLEPREAETPDERSLTTFVDELLAAPAPRIVAPVSTVPADEVRRVAKALRHAERGLIVVGRRASGASPRVYLELARKTGVPLVAEVASGIRFGGDVAGITTIDALDGVFGDALEAPDSVVRFGFPLTSSAFMAYERRIPPGAHHIVSGDGYPDPSNRAGNLIQADPDSFARALVDLLDATPTLANDGANTSATSSMATFRRSPWNETLSQRNARAWAALEDQLDSDRERDAVGPLAEDSSSPPASLSEPLAVRALLEALPQNSLLALGNSLSIRMVDWVGRSGSHRLQVTVQRGANGIDGLIAGAAGAAVATKRPTTLLLGDVSALHDLTSLAIARSSKQPLLIAVIDNGGGRIFDLLPHGQSEARRMPEWSYWATPPGIDWRAAAATFGVNYAEARCERDVKNTVHGAFGTSPGVTLLRIAVDGESASKLVETWRDIRERVPLDDDGDAPDQLAEQNPPRPAQRHDRRGRRQTKASLPDGTPSRHTVTDARRFLGEAQGPLLALHGFTGGPASFAEVTSGALCPWLCGHGLVPDESARDFNAELDRIAAWVKARSQSPVRLLGYSMGARVGLGLMLRYPEIVHDAVLVGANPGLDGNSTAEELRLREERLALEATWKGWLNRGLDEFLEEWQRLPVFRSQGALSESRRAWQAHIRRAHTAHGLHHAIDALGLGRMPNLWPELPNLRKRVLFVSGEVDDKFSRISERAASIVPDAFRLVMPQAGHNPILEAPEVFQELLAP